jgi:CelD/BcsL family acetyltransferase involved in cellulose biosynthesis
VAVTRDIPLNEVSPSDIERWRALAANAVDPNPFFEPDFVLAAARHLDEPGTSLLVVEGREGWLACLPVQRSRMYRLVPVLRTWNHIYCFLGTPLIDAGAVPEAAHALLEGAVRQAPGSRVALELVTEDGPAGEAIRRAATNLRLTTLLGARTERAFLERRPAGDYLAHMRSHRRRELNRLGRRMAKELDGGLSVTDEAGSEAAVDRFLELERAGWKGRSDSALASAPAHEAFFRSVCTDFFAAGRLQLLSLSVDERSVAMKCNLIAGDGAFCFKIAYDEQLGAFSPGVQLERENVQVFHEQRSEGWQDSCADPENEMINRLWPDRRKLSTTLLAPRGVRSSLSQRALRAAKAIRTRDRRTSSATS